MPDLEIDENIDKEELFYINQHFVFNYKKIQDFCKKYQISVQAMLITMLSRATRKYYTVFYCVIRPP